MTREEYVERMEKEDDWAPGWDAIDREFDRLYPGQEPAHYGTNIHARAIFGAIIILTDILFMNLRKAISI